MSDATNNRIYRTKADAPRDTWAEEEEARDERHRQRQKDDGYMLDE